MRKEGVGSVVYWLQSERGRPGTGELGSFVSAEIETLRRKH